MLLGPGVTEVTKANMAMAAMSGVAVPAFMSALSYYDAYRTERLPANLLQAQRDYFGAHTYQRLDKPGKFHTQWPKANPT